MVTLDVVIQDWDSYEEINLTLPCNIRDSLELSHEMMIMDWEGDIDIGECEDVILVNDVLKDINESQPNMDLDILSELLSMTKHSLTDVKFSNKVYDNDFMLEQVTSKVALVGAEERTAYYLAQSGIPFASGISENALNNMCSKEFQKIDWNEVWEYYEAMGFQTTIIDNKLYVFNWEDAE